MRVTTTLNTVILLFFLLAIPTPAEAYIGPGMGAGLIATVFGIIAAFFVALFAVAYYPVKRLLKGRRKPANRRQTAAPRLPDTAPLEQK